MRPAVPKPPGQLLWALPRRDGAYAVITLDRVGEPPYEQIRSQIARQVADGELPPGTKLPTVRALAATLGIAPNTVARAYRELEHSGVVSHAAQRHGRQRRRHRPRGQGGRDEYADCMRSLGIRQDEALGWSACLRPARQQLTATRGGAVLVHDEVRDALADGRPVVALESTIISHGLPRPDNAAPGAGDRAGGARRRCRAGHGRRHRRRGPDRARRRRPRPARQRRRRGQGQRPRPRRGRRARRSRRDHRRLDRPPGRARPASPSSPPAASAASIAARRTPSTSPPT